MKRLHTDLVGMKFGRWEVLGDSLMRSPSGLVLWLCRCECGRENRIIGSYLKSGRTKSCGCYKNELNRLRKNRLNHGKSSSKVYNLYRSMMSRCLDEKNVAYPRYGGRGIFVCDRWRKFEGFYDDMGDPPAGMTLERKDNDGPYSPDNCEWADRKRQANNRRSCVNFTLDGRTQTLKQWSDEYGVVYKTVWKRIQRGWSLSDALMRS